VALIDAVGFEKTGECERALAADVAAELRPVINGTFFLTGGQSRSAFLQSQSDRERIRMVRYKWRRPDNVDTFLARFQCVFGVFFVCVDACFGMRVDARYPPR
jgi:hypothetical protein